jgi:hypothetical protein
MNKLLFSLSILMFCCSGLAQESIIDPELMNQETWAEPYFPSEQELSREPNSEVITSEAPVKNADEYLGVLKTIPSSEPTLSRAWIEYKILHEN